MCAWRMPSISTAFLIALCAITTDVSSFRIVGGIARNTATLHCAGSTSTFLLAFASAYAASASRTSAYGLQTTLLDAKCAATASWLSASRNSVAESCVTIAYETLRDEYHV